MTIRLTTPEAFDELLEKLKKHPDYCEEINAPFFKHCYPDLREEVAKGEDEIYLDVDWIPDSVTCKVEMVIRYHKRSDIITDVKYLNIDDNETD